FPARYQGGNDGRRGTDGDERNDPGAGHGAPAAGAVRNLASRARGRRSRPQYAAAAPRSATRCGRVRARHDGVGQSLSGARPRLAISVSNGASRRTEAVVDFLEVAGLLTASV